MLRLFYPRYLEGMEGSPDFEVSRVHRSTEEVFELGGSYLAIDRILSSRDHVDTALSSRADQVAKVETGNSRLDAFLVLRFPRCKCTARSKYRNKIMNFAFSDYSGSTVFFSFLFRRKYR